MTVSESVLVALFIWAIVFVVLSFIFVLLHGFSKALRPLQPTKIKVTGGTDGPTATFYAEKDRTMPILSAGMVKLKDVDEPTAAMIMAIVGDESGIPLEELCFKSIKLVEGNES